MEKNYELELNQYFELFIKERPYFSDVQIKTLLQKDYYQGRIRGFFTQSVKKGTELIKAGFLVYGLKIKTFYNNSDPYHDLKTWVLYSPEPYFVKDPTKLYDIYEALNEYSLKNKFTFKERFLKAALQGDEEEPNALLIPPSITDGHLVFLGHLFLKQNGVSEMENTSPYIYVLMNLNKSKKIISVPESFLNSLKKE